MKPSVFSLFFLLLITGTLSQCSEEPDSVLSKSENTSRIAVDSLNNLGYNLWIRNPEKSVQLGERSYSIAEEINYQSGAAFAKRVSGVAYWAMGEPKNALEDLYAGLDLYADIGDMEGVGNCKLNIGMVYADINEDTTAVSFYKESINVFTSIQLDGRIGTAFNKLGSLYLKNGQLGDALFNLTNGLNIHTQNDFEYGMAEAHNRLGVLYLKQENIEQSDFHFRESLALSRKIDDTDGTINSMIQFGKLQLLKEEYEIAEVHLKWGLQQASNLGLNKYKLLAIENLVSLNKLLNRPDSALYYYDLQMALKDSIFNTNKSKQIAALEFKRDIKEKEKELLHFAEKEAYNRTIKWILFAGLWIIILLSIFLIKSLRERNKSQDKLMARERLLSNTEIESQKSERERLEKELELKNKELTSYAMNFVQKNDFINELQTKVSQLKSEANPDQKQQLSEIERTIKLQNSKEKHWEDFRLHFEQVYSGFFTNLKSEFPNLSPKDLKVAALTRLNLSIKETSNILGISPESTKTARYRLRKKLYLTAEQDLMEFLTGYDRHI